MSAVTVSGTSIIVLRTVTSLDQRTGLCPRRAPPLLGGIVPRLSVDVTFSRTRRRSGAWPRHARPCFDGALGAAERRGNLGLVPHPASHLRSQALGGRRRAAFLRLSK